MKKHFLVFVFVIGGFSGLCTAFPEPAVVQKATEWTIDVEFDMPRQITIRLPGETQPKRFWYIILTLTNNTAAGSVGFYPSCDLVTDTFETIGAGKGVPDIVFEHIKARHANKYPFLELIDHVGNKILEGGDNKRDIAVIWPDFDPKAKEISLLISGLSNETAAVDHPVEKDPDGKARKVLLRKTLRLNYSIGGDESLRERAGLGFVGKDWVMR